MLDKNQLKEYNKNFNDYDPKKAANINQIKSQLENFTGKKGGISIEESILYVEEPQKKPISKVENSSGKKKSDIKSPKNKDEPIKKQSIKSEKSPPNKKLPTVEEKKRPEISSESEEEEKTWMRGKDKKLIKKEPEDSGEPGTIRIVKKKNKPLIILTQINDKNVLKDYNFEKSFEINRQKDLKNSIILKNKEISKNHCLVHLIDNLGFFLQDVGSTNHTFIKILENSNIVLEEGMEIKMGDSLFEVMKLDSNKVFFDVLIDYEEEKPKKDKLEVKFNSKGDEIYFGRNPRSGSKPLEFTKDNEIDDEHAIFKKVKEKILFCPLITTNKYKEKMLNYFY